MKILVIDSQETYVLLQKKICKAINKNDIFHEISREVTIDEFNWYNLKKDECIVAVLNDEDSFKFVIHRIVNKNEFPSEIFNS